MRTLVPPVAADVTLDALDVDPYPLVARLRAEAPVCFAPALGRWLVSRRDLVLEVVEDPARFPTDSPRSLIGTTFGRQMLSTDGDEQRRHRAAYAGSFRPRTLRTERATGVGERAERVVGALAPGDDLTAAASLMAVSTVLDVLGLDAVAGPETVSRWYSDLAAALANVSGDPAVAARGRATAAAFGTALGEADLLTGAGDLTAEEQVSNTLLVLFGGIETTQSAILNAVWALATHPLVQSRLRADRGELPAVVEESLRWEPSVLTLTRFTTAPVELGGVTIPADSIVECLVAGANRDPVHFAEPDAFDPDRRNAGDHLTFGAGRHFCLGAHLARMETAAFLAALLDRSPAGFSFATADPPAPRGHEFRHPPRLELVW